MKIDYNQQEVPYNVITYNHLAQFSYDHIKSPEHSPP